MASKLHKAKHDRITMRNKLNCDSVCVSICQYCFIYIFSQSIVGYFNTLLSVTDRTDRENNQNTEQLNSCRIHLLFKHTWNVHKIDPTVGQKSQHISVDGNRRVCFVHNKVSWGPILNRELLQEGLQSLHTVFRITEPQVLRKFITSLKVSLHTKENLPQLFFFLILGI